MLVDGESACGKTYFGCSDGGLIFCGVFGRVMISPLTIHSHSFTSIVHYRSTL